MSSQTSPLVQNCYKAIQVARSYLNDETGVSWPDARLMPILIVAHSELSAKLVANGIQVIKNQSITITVPALNIITFLNSGGTYTNNILPTNTNPSQISSFSYQFQQTDVGKLFTLINGTNIIPGQYQIQSVSNGIATLNTQVTTGVLPIFANCSGVLNPTSPIPLSNIPSNLVFPISMMEKRPTDDVEFYLPMRQLNFIPQVDPVEELIYWAWIGNQIMLVGATQDVDVILRYRGSLAAPSTLNDTLGFIFAENFLGPRVAALALMSVSDDRWQQFNATAESNLDTVIRMNVVGNQGVGTRRGAYRRGMQRRIF